MKKAMLLSVAIVLCAALALAQDTAPGGSSQSTTSTSQTTTTEQNSSGKTIQGCLTGASGNYMLTDAMGMSYKVLGDESQLSDNVNKQVEVTGTVGATASASAGNNPDTNAPNASAEGNQGEANANAGNASGAASGGSATANASKTLTVSSVKKIADSCGAEK